MLRMKPAERAKKCGLPQSAAAKPPSNLEHLKLIAVDKMKRYRLKRLRSCCAPALERGDEGRRFGALSPHPNPLPNGEGGKHYRPYAQLAVVLLCGLGLKYFY